MSLSFTVHSIIDKGKFVVQISSSLDESNIIHMECDFDSKASRKIYKTSICSKNSKRRNLLVLKAFPVDLSQSCLMKKLIEHSLFLINFFNVHLLQQNWTVYISITLFMYLTQLIISFTCFNDYEYDMLYHNFFKIHDRGLMLILYLNNSINK